MIWLGVAALIVLGLVFNRYERRSKNPTPVTRREVIQEVQGFFAVALFFGIAFVIIDADWASDTHTVYRVDCKDGAWKGRRCMTQEMAAARIAYKAKFGDSQVVYWNLDEGEPLLFSLPNCLVRDAENWQCLTTGVRMVDGKVVDGNGADLFPQTPRLWWRALQVLGWFR